MFKNLKLRTKLIISLTAIVLISTIAAFVGNQLAFAEISEVGIPFLQAVNQTTELVGRVQAETLEFVATAEEETLEQLDQNINDLTKVTEQLKIHEGVHEEEAQVIEETTQLIGQLTTLGPKIIESHSQTLENLEDIENLEAEEISVTDETIAVIEAEVERHVQAGDLAELQEDSIPSLQELNAFVNHIRSMRIEILNFAKLGEEESIAEFEEAQAQVEATQVRLEKIMEPDEPGEANLVARLDEIEEQIETTGRAVFASHTNTLELLDELEDVEIELNQNLGLAQQAAQGDVAEGLSSATLYGLSTALITLVLAVLVGIFLAGTLAKPIANLAQTAEQMSTGNLSARTEISSGDEIGVLAGGFNRMADQLQKTLRGLEQRVADRTRALEISMDVSRRLSTILDEKQLVAEVVEQIRAAFDYYYAHVYLFDPKHEKLLMMGGTGEAGQVMLARSHALERGQGLVGRAADTNTVVLVPDVQKEPGWLPNPLLPETQAEVAVPITVGDEVLGVLDVQHNVAGGLQSADADLIQAIANQAAIALQNARAYARTQRQAEREAMLSAIGQKIQAAPTVDSAMQVAVRELGRALTPARSQVRLTISQSPNGQK